MAMLLRTAMLDFVKARVSTQQITRETGGTEINVLVPIMELIGGRHIDKLTRDEIEKAIGELIVAGYAVATINRAVNLIKAMYNRAIDVRLVTENPALYAYKPKGSARKVMVTLNRDDVETFIAASRQHKHGLSARIMAGTGMRRSEVLALLWSDFDGERLVVTKSRSPQRVKAPKSEAGRRAVFLPSDLRDELTAMKEAGASGYILKNTTGGAMGYYDMKDHFKAISQMCGVKVSPHDLRHYHASSLLSEGKSLPAISRRLGHASPTITLSLYAHAFEHEDRELVA
jgi:integrase